MGKRFKPLFRFIETGNLDEVLTYMDTKKYTTERCLTMAKRYPDVSYRMFLAIQKSASLGYLNIMNALIDRGFNFELNNYKELPPLHAACAGGYLDVARSLVEVHGVSPDQEGGEYKETPITALYSGDGLESENCVENELEIVRYLLSSGASVNKRNLLEQTPLWLAVDKGKAEICQLLILHGADVNICNVDKYSPLSMAVLTQNIDIVEILLDGGANPDIGRDDYDNAPFQAATTDHDIPIMKLLYTRGADIERHVHRGITPLQYAIYYGSYELARYLAIDAGARIDTIDKDGDTPFRVAFDGGHLEMADLLVKLGYNPRQNELINRREYWFRGQQELVEKWKKIISNPRTLSELCINKIRRISYPGRHLPEAVASLPLPQKLKDAIVMI